MPDLALWAVAVLSVAALFAGGWVAAFSTVRKRVAAGRQQVTQLMDQATAGSDPFGQLEAITEQLKQVDMQMLMEGEAVGLDEAALAAMPPPLPGGGGDASSVRSELGGDAELLKNELYAKGRRIEELEREKKTLADKIVRTEEALRDADGKVMEMQSRAIEQNTSAAMDRAFSADGVGSLMDALQQECDQLRRQLEERDAQIKKLEAGDSTGVVHELERIRAELMKRNEEVAQYEVKLHRAERRASDLKRRVDQLEGGGLRPGLSSSPLGSKRTTGTRAPKTVPPLPKLPNRPSAPPLRREVTSITKRSAIQGRPQRRKTGSIFPLPPSKEGEK